MKRRTALTIGLIVAMLGMATMGWAFVHGDNKSAKVIIITGGIVFVAGVIFFASFFKEKE